MGFLPQPWSCGCYVLCVWPYNALPHVPRHSDSKIVLRSDRHGRSAGDPGHDLAVPFNTIPNFGTPLCDLVCSGFGLAFMDKRICVHDNWSNGLQLHPGSEDRWHSCEEIWTLFRVARYFVSPLSLGARNSVTDFCSSFIVQLAGAVQAVGNNLTATQLLRGIHIYMGGVRTQHSRLDCLLLIFSC